jgi:uncharacterized protein YcfL
MKKIFLVLFLLMICSCSTDSNKDAVQITDSCTSYKYVVAVEIYQNRTFVYLSDEKQQPITPTYAIKVEVTNMDPMPKLGNRICSDKLVSIPY